MPKKVKIMFLLSIFSVLLPVNSALAADAIDLSAYTSETLEEAFQADSITFDFSTSNYNEAVTANKTILYVFRKDGCSNCKRFLEFIASDLLPSYADKFVVKSFEVSQNPSNMNLVAKLAKFYGQESSTGAYGTPIVVAGSTFSTGFVDEARRAEIKSIIQNGDTYDAVAEINKGVTSFETGTRTSFTSDGVTFTSATGLNNYFHIETIPLNLSTIKLNGYDYISAYDISLYNYNTVVPVSSGQYTITIPVDKAYDTYRVAYIDATGKIAEEFDTTAENGKITFRTTHLSDYAIYGRGASVKDSTKNPKTLDSIVIYGGIFAISVLVLAGSIIGYRKLSQK